MCGDWLVESLSELGLCPTCEAWGREARWSAFVL